MATSVSFPISNGWTITSQIKLSSLYNKVSWTASVVGQYCNAFPSPLGNGVILGNVDLLANITIDGECPVQGTLARVNTVLNKIQRAVNQGTGNAVLMGKNLIISTGQ
jgi:hypothetical protein